MSWMNSDDYAVSTFLQGLGEVSLQTSCSGIDPCVPLKLTPIVNGCLCSGKSMATFPGSPYGTTCEPSMDSHGTDMSTSLQAASPVNPGALQEPVRETQIVATSGLIPSGWFAQYDHATSSWRTCQGSLLTLTLDVFSETWPKQGTMHAGVCWEQTTLAHHTAENGSGSWLPTPTAHQGGWNQGGGNGREGQPIRPSLQHMARHNLWPTPQAFDALDIQRNPAALARAKEKGGSTNLREVVHLWKTPTAEDCRDRAFARNNRGEPKLSAQVKMTAPWATPTAHPRTHSPRQVAHGEQLANQVGGSLNPTWVEWLMGWPLGWTALEPLAMGRCRSVPQWLGTFSWRD